MGESVVLLQVIAAFLTFLAAAITLIRVLEEKKKNPPKGPGSKNS